MASPYRTDVTLTADRLKELFSYSPETGLFTRRVRVGQTGYAGVVMPPSDKGYVRFPVDGCHYFAHRLAWLYMTEEWPAHEVDHEDRDRSNNRWKNLRAATPKQNRENIGEQRNNTSGHRGIHWLKATSKWCARISHHGRRIALGCYLDKAEAIEVRDLAETMLFTHSPLEMTHG